MKEQKEDFLKSRPRFNDNYFDGQRDPTEGWMAATNASRFEYDLAAFTAGMCDLDQANGRHFDGQYMYVMAPNVPFALPGHFGN